MGRNVTTTSDKTLKKLLFLAILIAVFYIIPHSKSYAQATCNGGCAECTCPVEIANHHLEYRDHVTSEFERLREQIVYDFFEEYVLPTLQQMTAELTTTGIHQTLIIGTFFDAKHQLETQRLYQQLTAEAHKDYHPSRGICAIGTTVRSLAVSEQDAHFNQIALSNRMMARQNAQGSTLSGEVESDRATRLYDFIAKYCDADDNGTDLELAQGGLGRLCAPANVRTAANGTPHPRRKNQDVDYTNTIENKLTIDLNYRDGEVTVEEEDVFALSANLFAHDVSPILTDIDLATQNEEFREAAFKLLNLRSVAAKRSVAQNSFAAIAAMKASGEPESAPFIKRIVNDLGVNVGILDDYIGENPSYFAQMEVLTKMAFQNPKFYAELYDKPVNIERKGAALQAIGLMQDRDIYKSLLRSEMVLATLLETLMHEEQDRTHSAIKRVIQIQGEEVEPTP